MTTEESLEQLLDLGLPPKLNQVSECPLDEDDFVAFRSQGDQCLHIAEKLQIGMTNYFLNNITYSLLVLRSQILYF